MVPNTDLVGQALRIAVFKALNNFGPAGTPQSASFKRVAQSSLGTFKRTAPTTVEDIDDTDGMTLLQFAANDGGAAAQVVSNVVEMILVQLAKVWKMYRPGVSFPVGPFRTDLNQLDMSTSFLEWTYAIQKTWGRQP